MQFPRLIIQIHDAGEASAASSDVNMQLSLDIPYVNQSVAFFNAAPGALSIFSEASRHVVSTMESR
jgi:hypothetical protein